MRTSNKKTTVIIISVLMALIIVGVGVFAYMNIKKNKEKHKNDGKYMFTELWYDHKVADKAALEEAGRDVSKIYVEIDGDKIVLYGWNAFSNCSARYETSVEIGDKGMMSLNDPYGREITGRVESGFMVVNYEELRLVFEK